MGERMLSGMKKAAEGHEDFVVAVRGKGLLMAVEFINNELGFALSKAMLDRGVLVSGTLVNARVIRFEPPLTIAEEQADYACRAMAEALDEISGKVRVA